MLDSFICVRQRLKSISHCGMPSLSECMFVAFQRTACLSISVLVVSVMYGFLVCLAFVENAVVMVSCRAFFRLLTASSRFTMLTSMRVTFSENMFVNVSKVLSN